MKDIAMVGNSLCYFKYLSLLSKLSHQSLKMLKTNPESFQNAVQPSKFIFDRIHKSPCSCRQPTSMFLCFPTSRFGNSTCMFLCSPMSLCSNSTCLCSNSTGMFFCSPTSTAIPESCTFIGTNFEKDLLSQV